jgi:hypothetical protein
MSLENLASGNIKQAYGNLPAAALAQHAAPRPEPVRAGALATPRMPQTPVLYYISWPCSSSSRAKFPGRAQPGDMARTHAAPRLACRPGWTVRTVDALSDLGWRAALFTNMRRRSPHTENDCDVHTVCSGGGSAAGAWTIARRLCLWTARTSEPTFVPTVRSPAANRPSRLLQSFSSSKHGACRRRRRVRLLVSVGFSKHPSTCSPPVEFQGLNNPQSLLSLRPPVLHGSNPAASAALNDLVSSAKIQTWSVQEDSAELAPVKGHADAHPERHAATQEA